MKTINKVIVEKPTLIVAIYLSVLFITAYSLTPM